MATSEKAHYWLQRSVSAQLPAASENLLLLDFRDCLLPAHFADGKSHLVADVHCVQLPFLRFELFGSCVGIRSDSAGLRLLNCDGPTDPIDCGDCSRKGLLGQCHRTDAREHGTSQNHLSQSLRSLPAFA